KFWKSGPGPGGGEPSCSSQRLSTGRHPRHGGWGLEGISFLRTALLQTSAMIRRTHKMARLVGVDLPREKRVEIALTYIFGMGLTRSQKTLAATGISPETRVKDLQEPELAKLREFIEANFKIEGDLRREVAADI